MSTERVFGLLNLHKPVGPSSHAMVAAVRRLTGVRKVGHAGTLDPMASGVLVLCLGAATRLSEYAMRSTKQYRAFVRLGITTDTYDSEGEVIAERPVGDLTVADIEAALTPFLGEIDQIPPMYSAIKQDGKRLYELARQGKAVERPARRVTIAQIDVVEMSLPDIVLDVTCSPGTYIRSLAYDLGEGLGTGAYLTGLIRRASGSFHVDDAVPLADFEAAAQEGRWRELLLPPDQAVLAMTPVQLTEADAERVRHGNAVDAPAGSEGNGRAYAPDGTLLALVTVRDGQWHPVKVFPQ